MKNTNTHIEIVSSTLSELSSMSHTSRQAILAILLRHYVNVRITIVNELANLEALVARRPDLVFLGMKFIPAHPDLGFDDVDKIWLADYLDSYHIATTGSPQTAHELELNKHLAKQRVASAGLATARFCVVTQDLQHNIQTIPLTFPLFVKPTNRGGGSGIDSNSLVRDFDQLNAKVSSISHNIRSDSIVEEYLTGREFSVAVLKDDYGLSYSVMPIEKIAPLGARGERILSRRVKSEDLERNAEVIDTNTRAKLTDLAMQVFEALGARDYGRIDIRMDTAGVPHFLEANLIPSLIEDYGSFPWACKINKNLGHEAMLLQIVRLGLLRSSPVTKDEPKFDLTKLIPLQAIQAATELA